MGQFTPTLPSGAAEYSAVFAEVYDVVANILRDRMGFQARPFQYEAVFRRLLDFTNGEIQRQTSEDTSHRNGRAWKPVPQTFFCNAGVYLTMQTVLIKTEATGLEERKSEHS